MSFKTESELNKKNNLGNSHYFHTFDWFSKVLVSSLKNVSEDFLARSFNFHLISISETYDILFKGDEYFVSEIKITDSLSAKIRLSSSAVDLILSKTLGSNNDNQFFLLSRITELEAKIITAFNNEIYKTIKPLLKSQSKLKKLTQEKKLKNSLLFLTFYIYDDEENYGKIILTVPQQIFESPIPIPPPLEELPDSLFRRSLTDVDIFVGRTRSSLDDLNKLEKDDIIVLEHSKIGKMYIGEGFECVVKAKPDVSLVYEYENTDYGEDNMSKKLTETKMWDNIQVDVSAEFDKVKMSLGELKQISEGLVVDLASVYQNKITLKVENSRIADGELIIIGDRYGVRLTAIYNQDETPSTSEVIAEEEEPEEINHPEADEESEEESEDFDMDDFDIEEDNEDEF